MKRRTENPAVQDALQRGRLKDWEVGFARSIIAQARQRQSRFNPTAKQIAAIHRILAGLGEPESMIDDEGLIDEEEADHDCAA